MKLTKTFYILLLVTGIAACDKTDDQLGVPRIEWVTYGPQEIKAFSDSVYFEVYYEDQDGDIGINDPSAYNLFLEDQRIPLTYKFRISELTPDRQALSISGNLKLSLPNTVLVNGSTAELVNYKLYLVDRAGHQSNILTTNALNVIP
ncbi:MAG: hypothetical protein EP332_11355 [Bacteroidetes bacterium]|nr:MAG: hypothetical protein EP332_11355 [Bacteroidota bacterium]